MPTSYPPRPSPLARLEDVAQLAGVSAATASRVLTGSANVRPQTRRQVEQAIEKLGYRRNRAARNGSRRAGSIALVVCEESTRLFTDPFFGRLLQGVNAALAGSDEQLVLLSMHGPSDCRRYARFVRDGHVDGAVFVSLHGALPTDLRDLGIPVVFVGRPVDGAEDASYVDADNLGGAEAAVGHVLAGGRRVVATVAGPPDMAAGLDRLRGYHRALAEHGWQRPDLVAYGDYSAVSAEHAVYRLLDRQPDIDAVFATSDLMAAGALRALRRTGRRVPEDVAVIGFGDEPLARHTSPPLTTVRQPVEELGTRAMGELLAVIEGGLDAPSHEVLPTELIVRASA